MEIKTSNGSKVQKTETKGIGQNKCQHPKSHITRISYNPSLCTIIFLGIDSFLFLLTIIFLLSTLLISPHFSNFNLQIPFSNFLLNLPHFYFFTCIPLLQFLMPLFLLPPFTIAILTLIF